MSSRVLYMRQRGTNRGGDAVAVHHRLCAVLTGADGNAFAIENRPDVVRMHAVHHERQDAGLLRALRR